MLPEIERLLELQTLDAEIARIQDTLSRYPSMLQGIEDSLKKSRADYQKVVDTHREIMKNRLALEALIRQKEHLIMEKSARQMQQKIKQDAYNLLKQEMEALREEIGHIEDQILDIINQEDAAEKRIPAVLAKLKKLESESADEKKRIESQTSDKQRRIEQLMGEREKQAALVKPDLLAYYMRFFKAYGPNVLVPLDNNTCGGCHMMLMPQSALEIRGGQSVIECEGCRRILYSIE